MAGVDSKNEIAMKLGKREEDDTLENDERIGFMTIIKKSTTILAEELSHVGADYAKTYMAEKLNEWRSQQLDIALIGASGVGKSTFANTIRGVAAEDRQFAAPVGVRQTTRQVKGYADPGNPNLKYWDLPGVGTAEFPRNETYLEKIEFERFDFFLIFSALRFREDDLWLAKHIQKTGKKFFFIRGKVDLDLKNERQDHPNSFKEENVLAGVRQATMNELERAGFSNIKVFLLSNKSKSKWDFPLLCQTLISESAGLKEEAMTLSLKIRSKELVDKKTQVLKGRVKWISGLSAMGALVPLPGISLAADAGLIYKEYKLYKEQLQLDDDSLNSLCETLSVDQRNRLEEIRSGEMMKVNNYDTVLLLIKGFSRSALLEEASRLVVGIGTVIASGISYATTLAMLTSILDKLSENAHRVAQIAAGDESDRKCEKKGPDFELYS